MASTVSPARSWKQWRGWPTVAGILAFLSAGWFVWSEVLVWRWRMENRISQAMSIKPWSAINALAFLAIGIAALLRRERVKPVLVIAGAVNVVFSGLAIATNPWDAVNVAIGAGLIACGLLWDTPAG